MGVRIFAGDNPWETYKGERLDDGYIQWLKREQDDMNFYFQRRIKELGGS